ncbi:hypothetical protein MMC25_000032 [Agyrium rufum]|nr:hypothetical protein [Agyrium rufum]
MSSSPSPKIYVHPNPERTLLPHLISLLPYTLPICRRLQFHFQSPHRQILSTLPPDTPLPPASSERPPPPVSETAPTSATASHPKASPNESSVNQPPFVPILKQPPTPFAAAYIDRSREPETAAWIFSTIELPSSETSPALALAQVCALLSFHRDSHPLVAEPSSPSASTSETNGQGSTNLSLENPTPVKQNGQRSHHFGAEDADGDKPAAAVGEARSESEKANQTLLVGAMHRLVLELLKGGEGIGEGKHVISGPDADPALSTPLVSTSAISTTTSRGTDDGDTVASESHPSKDRYGGKAVDQAHGTERRNCIIISHTVPYLKYIIPPSSSSPDSVAIPPRFLPSHLTWSHLPSALTPTALASYDLIRSRTQIPRTARTLRLLPNVVLRDTSTTSSTRSNANTTDDEKEGNLVAWAFLGPDASLTSLHVEPNWRGRGVGKILAGKVCGLLGSSSSFSSSFESSTISKKDNSENEELEIEENKVEAAEDDTTNIIIYDDGTTGKKEFRDVCRGVDDWNHSDAAADNAASLGVASGLGGRLGWECFWVWVDLGRA